MRSSFERNYGEIPIVKLGPHFRKVHDYDERFKSIPDILELDHLTV